MSNSSKISARLFQNGETYTVSVLTHKQLHQIDHFYWSCYSKFKSPEEAAIWFFTRYIDVPLIWLVDPTLIPL